MKTIKRFLPGDKVPDDSVLITTVQYIDYKEQKRIVEFYYLVPSIKPSRKR